MKTELAENHNVETFTNLFDLMADGLLIFVDGSISACNYAALDALGYTQEVQVLGKRLSDFSPPMQSDTQLSDLTEKNLMTALRTKKSMRCEWLLLRTNGEVFPVEILFTALPGKKSRTIGALWRDISKRKNAELELQHAHQNLEKRVEERTHQIEQQQQVAEGLRDILSILNSNRTIHEILDYIVLQTANLLGNDAGAVYLAQGHKLQVQASLGLDPEHLADTSISLGEGPTAFAVREKRPIVISNTTNWIDDTVISARSRALSEKLARSYQALLVVPLIVKDQVYGAITLYYREAKTFSPGEVDLAMAFGNQAALAIENAYLRVRAGETAAAAERDRIARDLHDSVTQTLFSATLISQVLPRLWEQNKNEGQKQLEELRLLTRGALAEMRTLLLELRPAAFAKVALPESLRQLVEAAIGRSGIRIALALEGDTLLPPDVKVAFYRIAQEALNNVVKHSEADSAQVMLIRQRDRAKLQISDNGVGFVNDKVPDGHFGLTIMSERAQSIGGRLTIETLPGQGTHVMVIWEQAVRGS